MPSQTFLVCSHARTIHTHPVTFVCAECHTTTTREIYPGKIPIYCLSCRPRRKRAAQERPSKGMFHPTHYLMRAILVEVAWRAIKKDSALEEFFNRLYPRTGKTRAIIAVARKLIGRIRAAFKKKEFYQIGFSSNNAYSTGIV